MPPEEDARAILRLALRHEQSLAASLDPAFALLKGLIELAGEQPPLSHDGRNTAFGLLGGPAHQDQSAETRARESAGGSGEAAHRQQMSLLVWNQSI